MDNDKNLFSFYYEKNVHDLNRKAFLCVQFAFSHWNKLMFFSKYLISDFHNISYWTQLILLLICVWAIFFTLQYRQKCLFKRQAYVFGFHCLIEIVGLVYKQPFTTFIQHYNVSFLMDLVYNPLPSWISWGIDQFWIFLYVMFCMLFLSFIASFPIEPGFERDTCCQSKY